MLFLPFLSNFHTPKQILLMIKLILVTESHHGMLPLVDLKVKYCFAILVYMLVFGWVLWSNQTELVC